MTSEQATTAPPKQLLAGGMVALLIQKSAFRYGFRYDFRLTVGLTPAIRGVPGILVGPVVGSMIGRLDPRRLAVTGALGAAALGAAALVGGLVAAHMANWSTPEGGLCTAGLMAVPILLTARWYFTPPAPRARVPA
jgi:hypothetical protein